MRAESDAQVVALQQAVAGLHTGGKGSGITNGSSRGRGNGGSGRGRGEVRTKVGDTREMGGVSLVAVMREGRLAWEPVDGIESTASREAQQRVVKDEARWVKEQEAAVKEQRVQQARDLEKRERERKAELFGAENVYRSTKVRGPLLPVPKLLLSSREEEKAARAAGMDQSAPKKYMFIKESLDALEAQYAAKERAAREQMYERNRRRLKLSSSADMGQLEQEDEMGEGEEEDLRTRLSKMSDEEFKALAMARKERAKSELLQPPKPPPAPPAASVRSERGGKKKVRQPLDPKDDPDYRR